MKPARYIHDKFVVAVYDGRVSFILRKKGKRMIYDRVTIYIQDDALLRRVYVFWLDDYTMTLKLDHYRREIRQTKRHNWKTDLCWSRLDQKHSNIRREDILLTDEIKELARDQFIAMITVEE